jgi:hypothetical protein
MHDGYFVLLAISKTLARRAANKERRTQADIGPEQGPAAWLAAPSTPESGDIPLIAGIRIRSRYRIPINRGFVSESGGVKRK